MTVVGSLLSVSDRQFWNCRIWGLERWHSGQEHWELLQRTQVQFLAPTALYNEFQGIQCPRLDSAGIQVMRDLPVYKTPIQHKI